MGENPPAAGKALIEFSFEFMIRHFLFVFTNGDAARFDTFFEALMYNSNPRIQNFHLNFKIIPKERGVTSYFSG